MDIIKLIKEHRLIEGLEPEEILDVLNEPLGYINNSDWVIKVESCDGIIIENKIDNRIKTINCVLDYFDFGDRNCPMILNYYKIDGGSTKCSRCLRCAISDYLSGRIKINKKQKKKGI